MRHLSKNQIEAALDGCIEQLKAHLDVFTHQFQDAASVNNFYKPIENTYWTNGFCTGQLWLAYEYSKDNIFKEAADIQVESFYNRILNKIEVDHHDMGFLYSLSCVASYKLTGNEKAKEAAIMASDHLMTRFHEKGGFIQAWGSLDKQEHHRLIIDCLLNVPMLHWATEVTGDKNYEKIALIHSKTALDNVIREDNSTHHTFYFDMATGKPLYGETCQGYSNESAWARGQAWGVYGSAISYRYTKDERYKTTFEKVTKYYMEHLPEDKVPYWDLIFSDGSDEPRDSSSAAIVACGLLEMADHVGGEEGNSYTNQAKEMLSSLIDNYMVKDKSVSNGLLLHGTYSNSSPYNTCNHYGVDECTIWGDYFFMEALVRLNQRWCSYW